eukprot:4082892-Karenia_brevis.AAC.1
MKRETLHIKRAAWRTKGLHVCRHGMFFRSGYGPSCACVQAVPNFQGVQYMPVLDHLSKTILAKPFERDGVQRLG